MNINMNHLYYFQVLSETLSFTKAAKILNVAQPAVSRSIKSLEQQLDTGLFIRNNKSVILTDAGVKLKHCTSLAFKNIEQGLYSLQKKQELSGVLRIGSLRELGEDKILLIAKDFQKTHPKVKIEMILGGNTELQAKLQRNEIDFIFGISVSNQESIRSFKFLDQKSYLITNKKTLLHKYKNIMEMPFIAYQLADPLLKKYLQTFYPKQAYKSLDIKFSVNSHRSIVDLLKDETDLFAILPEFSPGVQNILKSKELQVVKKHSLRTDLFLSYWAQEFPPKVLEEFKMFALNYI
jgi:DNA-binding transcriptional LysR family regulator